jgi:O-antigen/teichoic acid export membrane protein
MKPVFSSLEGKGDFQQIRDKFLFTSKLNTVISIFIGGSILIFGKAFILTWMGDQYLDSCYVLLVLTVGLIFNTIQLTPATLLYGISKHKVYSILMVAEGLIHLALSLLLVRRYGILGVAVGSAIPMLINSVVIIPVYANRVIGLRLWEYARVVGKGIIFGALIHVASWLIIRNLILNSYMRIFILGSATSAAFIISNTMVLFSREERRFFKIPF